MDLQDRSAGIQVGKVERDRSISHPEGSLVGFLKNKEHTVIKLERRSVHQATGLFGIGQGQLQVNGFFGELDREIVLRIHLLDGCGRICWLAGAKEQGISTCDE